MYIHRHIKSIDNVLFLINISYEYEESYVILTNFTMHPIVDEIVGANIVKNKVDDFDEFALNNIYDILITDGIFGAAGPHK